MTYRNQKKVFKFLVLGAFPTAGGGFSRLGNGVKGCPACIYKRGFYFQYACKFLSLLFSGRITLKVISHYFHHYLFKIYRCIQEHLKKKKYSLFLQYCCAPLFLHLKQWQTTNEAVSLTQVRYASKPRNPE